MDKIDIKILSHLLNNCRTPDRQIGKSVGISGGAVKSRIQKMIDAKVIEDFALKIEPPVLGYSVLYFVVAGKDLKNILGQVSLVGEPFFVVPCVGGITVCSIVVKEDPNKKMELAKKLMKNVRVLSIFEAQDTGIRSDLTKTDLDIIDILLKDPRMQIDQIAKSTGFSTKTVARSLDKLQNDEAIQFTLVYDPMKLTGYIPFAILVGVTDNVKKTLLKLKTKFSESFLQKSFVHMNQIVLFLYSDDIFKIDEITQLAQKIERVHSVDLFIPKKITLPQRWVKNSIALAKRSKKLHLSYQIHS